MAELQSVRLNVFQRTDEKWGWRLISSGNVIATDGNQGYENKAECEEMGNKVINGHYSGAQRTETLNKKK